MTKDGAGPAGRVAPLPPSLVLHAEHGLEVLLLEAEAEAGIGERVQRAARLTQTGVRLTSTRDPRVFAMQLEARPPALAICEVDTAERMAWLRDLANRSAGGHCRTQFVAVAADAALTAAAGTGTDGPGAQPCAGMRLLGFGGPVRRLLLDSYLYYSCASKAPLRRAARTLSIA